MNKGTRVRVMNPASLFHGREGTVLEVRLPPLPIGIRLLAGQAAVWFDLDELEEIQNAEIIQPRGVLSILNS